MAKSNNHGWRQFLLSRSGLVLVAFLAIGGYFLWAEHQAHIVVYLPLILFIGLCLGFHSFMHGGHGDHRDHRADSDEPGRDDR